MIDYNTSSSGISLRSPMLKFKGTGTDWFLHWSYLLRSNPSNATSRRSLPKLKCSLSLKTTPSLLKLGQGFEKDCRNRRYSGGTHSNDSRSDQWPSKGILVGLLLVHGNGLLWSRGEGQGPFGRVLEQAYNSRRRRGLVGTSLQGYEKRSRTSNRGNNLNTPPRDEKGSFP